MQIQEVFSKVVINLCICVVCTCPEETRCVLATKFIRESVPMDGQMASYRRDKKLVEILWIMIQGVCYRLHNQGEKWKRSFLNKLSN